MKQPRLMTEQEVRELLEPQYTALAAAMSREDLERAYVLCSLLREMKKVWHTTALKEREGAEAPSP